MKYVAPNYQIYNCDTIFDKLFYIAHYHYLLNMRYNEGKKYIKMISFDRNFTMLRFESFDAKVLSRKFRSHP